MEHQLPSNIAIEKNYGIYDKLINRSYFRLERKLTNLENFKTLVRYTGYLFLMKFTLVLEKYFTVLLSIRNEHRPLILNANAK